MANATRNGKRRTAIIAALATSVVFLIYLNWQIFNANIDSSPIAVQANTGTSNQTADNDALLAPPAPRSRSDFMQTVTRPLFTPTRRPIERKPKVVDNRIPMTARDSAADKFQLIGVYQDQGGDNARALIRPGPTAAGLWMSVGEDIEGWRLREVRNDVAVIETGGRRRELRLYPESDTKPGQP